MNVAQPLAELARYLESQIPGAVPTDAPTTPSPGSPPSETLIASLFERQLRLNSPAASFLKRRGLHSPAQTLAAIPAIPIAAFKHLELTTVPEGQRTTVFHSSGTTGQTPSRHHHSAETLHIYNLASEAWFKRRMLGHLPWSWQRRRPEAAERRSMLSLTPPPHDAPCSSLVHMIAHLFRCFGSPASTFAGTNDSNGWNLIFDRAIGLLKSSATTGAPVIVFGTAFNFVHLLDDLARRGETIPLPPGSQIMETGGYKGRSRVVPQAELHEALCAQFGVPLDHIVCEYGMCELSSQAYDADFQARCHTAPRRFQFPPWCRASVISPETGRETGIGEIGLLEITDLANVASVLGIQTEDLAVRHADGFTLKGRATQSEPRGCSLLTLEK